MEQTEKIDKGGINYALAATLVAGGASYDEAAAQTGAKSGNSLRVGLHKRGATKTLLRQLPIAGERSETACARIGKQAAEVMRSTLGDRLLDAVNASNGKRIAYKDLASKGQGHAAVLKTLAETHRLLYGGAETQVNIFGVEHMETKTIDVQSERVESTETQES